MIFPDGVEAAVYELRAKLGVPAAVIHLHFSSDGKVQKIVPEVVFTPKKLLDSSVKCPHS